MKYKDSSLIFKEIKKANKVLINCHRSPDPDGVGSALSMYQVLLKMGKKAEIVGPDIKGEDFAYLPFSDKIKKADFTNFSYKDYDLFIALDSASWDMVCGRKDLPLFKMPMVVMDHHQTNTFYGKINLVDPKVSSCAELLYGVFEDWGVNLDKDVATTLLAGIIGDTGVFRYPGVTTDTFEVVKKLMDLGADKDGLILEIYNSVDMTLVKFWGKVIEKMEIDTKHRFVWSAISFDEFKKSGMPESGKESAASSLFQSVKETDFGMVMVEEREKSLGISFRSRTGFDVSKIAGELGGGGHVGAAGARLAGLKFDKAVKKVLDVARRTVNEER